MLATDYKFSEMVQAVTLPIVDALPKIDHFLKPLGFVCSCIAQRKNLSDSRLSFCKILLFIVAVAAALYQLLCSISLLLTGRSYLYSHRATEDTW